MLQTMSDYKYKMFNIYHYYDGPLTFTGTTIPDATFTVSDGSEIVDPWFLLYFEYDDEATEQFGEGFGFWEERVYRAYQCGTNNFEYVRESEIDRGEAS